MSLASHVQVVRSVAPHRPQTPPEIIWIQFFNFIRSAFVYTLSECMAQETFAGGEHRWHFEWVSKNRCGCRNYRRVFDSYSARVQCELSLNSSHRPCQAAEFQKFNLFQRLGESAVRANQRASGTNYSIGGFHRIFRSAHLTHLTCVTNSTLHSIR